MLYVKLVDRDGGVIRCQIDAPAAKAGFDLEKIRHAFICQTLGDGSELDLCGTTWASEDEIARYIAADSDNAEAVAANLAAASEAERAQQPRERAVRCTGCTRETWNVSGRCDACELSDSMHRHPAGKLAQNRRFSTGQTELNTEGTDGICPDCGTVVWFPFPPRPGEDAAWKHHFDHCEPHQARTRAEDWEPES